MAAADHAAAALDAAGPLRSAAAEIGIGDRFARLSEKDADLGGVITVAAADFIGDFVQDVVGLALATRGRRSEHPLGGAIVGREVVLPVAQPAPLRIGEDAVGRNEERVGIDQAAAADAAAMQHHHVAQHRDGLNAEAPQQRRPEELAQVPVGLGKVFAAPTLATLDDDDAIAFFGQPQRRHATAEARADDQIVAVQRR